MPLSKIRSMLLLPHHPGATHPTLSLANCYTLSSSPTPAETQTSMGPCWGAKLHWLPYILGQSLKLVIIRLAARACQRASLNPLL